MDVYQYQRYGSIAENERLCRGGVAEEVLFLCREILTRRAIYSTLQYVIEPLGEFEQVVLLAILRLGDEAYGASIRREIETCTGREPTPGAMYTTLDRLEGKGMVCSRMGEPTAQRGGRAKRFFVVAEKGSAALIAAQMAYKRLLKGLKILGGADA
jgi:DNA-binding PadR family transcriptional regulator